jgi:hypothetical protein
MWSALENVAFRESLPAPLQAGDSIRSILVTGQLDQGRCNLYYLGRRRSRPYLLKQFYGLDTHAFLRWQNEARFIDLPPHPGYVWPCEEWRGGLISPVPDGVSLTTWLKAAYRPPAARLRAASWLASRILCLHDSGIVHRNLTPSCVRISDTILQLSDFGAACCQEWDDFWADSLFSCNTPACSSPESLRGDPYGPEQDMYGVGALLYLLFTGTLPFDAPKLLFRRAFPGSVKPGHMPFAHELPRLVYDLTMACLANNPSDRPTAREAAALLQEYGEGCDVGQIAFPPSPDGQDGEHLMVFISDDERAAPLFDAVIRRAAAGPCLLLFVGLIPGNLPSGHRERFAGNLYRKLAQGLIRCRLHHVQWSLRVVETAVPERTALELVRRYRPDRVYLGRQTTRKASSFSRSFQRAHDAGRVQVTYVV